MHKKPCVKPQCKTVCVEVDTTLPTLSCIAVYHKVFGVRLFTLLLHSVHYLLIHSLIENKGANSMRKKTENRNIKTKRLFEALKKYNMTNLKQQSDQGEYEQLFFRYPWSQICLCEKVKVVLLNRIFLMISEQES